MRQTDGQIGLVDSDGEVDFAVNAIAAPAMKFMTEISSFYVRELPGRLMDEEKVALVATLVQHRFLRVAA